MVNKASCVVYDYGDILPLLTSVLTPVVIAKSVYLIIFMITERQISIYLLPNVDNFHKHVR